MTQTRPKLELAQLCDLRNPVSVHQGTIAHTQQLDQNIWIRAVYYTQLAELGITENQ